MTLKEFSELKPSALLELAMRCLLEMERDSSGHYIISMTDQHTVRETEPGLEKTFVGLAGCVLAKFFNAPHNKTINAAEFKNKDAARKLQGLVYIALGDPDMYVQYGWTGQFPERKLFDRKRMTYSLYFSDRQGFKDYVGQVVEYLKNNNI